MATPITAHVHVYPGKLPLHTGPAPSCLDVDALFRAALHTAQVAACHAHLVDISGTTRVDGMNTNWWSFLQPESAALIAALEDAGVEFKVVEEI